jgi:hypothetical protein
MIYLAEMCLAIVIADLMKFAFYRDKMARRLITRLTSEAVTEPFL